MKLDTNEIPQIIQKHSYREIMIMAEVSKSTATKWKSGQLNWRTSNFNTIEKLVAAYRKEGKEIEDERD